MWCQAILYTAAIKRNDERNKRKRKRLCIHDKDMFLYNLLKRNNHPLALLCCRASPSTAETMSQGAGEIRTEQNGNFRK